MTKTFTVNGERMTKYFAVRVTESEHELVKRKAMEAGTSVDAMIRSMLGLEMAR